MIVFLTEEESIKAPLMAILTQLWPDSHEGLDWQIISFPGKAALEKRMVTKMQSWTYNNPHFVIVRDNDGGDCAALKQRLCSSVSPLNKSFHIRIICQELESWFLGDLQAVESAFPAVKADQQNQKSKYRNPDQLNNASQELEKITGLSGKVSRSESISKHLNLSQNRSHCFNLIVKTLKQLIPAHS